MEWLNTVDSILNSSLANTIMGNNKKSPTPAPVSPAPVITVQNPVEKKTPWGLIAGGVGAVIVILILVIKKK